MEAMTAEKMKNILTNKVFFKIKKILPHKQETEDVDVFVSYFEDLKEFLINKEEKP